MLDTRDSKLKLLTDKNSILLLVDYRPSMIKSIASGDKVRIKGAAINKRKPRRYGYPSSYDRSTQPRTAIFSLKCPAYFPSGKYMHENYTVRCP